MRADVADQAYVVVSGRSLSWAIRADLILEIVAEADYRGDLVADVAKLWGETMEGSTPRVLVVRTLAGPRGIRATHITYRSVALSDVCPLPTIMARTPAARFVAGLVFEAPHPALVVLDPEGLSYDRAG